MTEYYVFFDEGGTSETFAEKVETEGTILAGEIKQAKYVKVSASTAQKAATAVKEAFGSGDVTLKALVGTTSNIEEKSE